ncbi:MAG: 4Fe-4S binding protein [Myxococcales bacterium]|nr:4Fe-4S binding protein [Myxococcales bacterium]
MIEVEQVWMGEKAPPPAAVDDLFFVQVDPAKCQKCGECQSVCGTGAIQPGDGKDGPRAVVDPAACVHCGQCLYHCPYGAIYENVSFLAAVRKALADPDKVVVAMPAPAVRYALGEAFGLDPGQSVNSKMFAALRRLGFDYVWDNEMTADVTILEEGTELIARLTKQSDKPLPQFTSCCPAWIKFVETYYPDLRPHLSTCKSPIGMLGALAKTYGADVTKQTAEKIYTVSIMPCIAKKYEGLRPEMAASGFRDIDATLHTRELAYLIKSAGIDFAKLPEEAADPALGDATGAATIFCATGGVMEAALRFAFEAVSGQELQNVELTAVRGRQAVRSAAIPIPNGPTVKVGIVHGLENARMLCEEVRAGKSPYHFIEVMNCPGGCVNGAGQPIPPGVRMSGQSLFGRLFAHWNRKLSLRRRSV